MPTKREAKVGNNEGEQGSAPTEQERRLYNAYVKRCLRTGEDPLPFGAWLSQHRGG